MNKEFTRRDFIKGTAAGIAGVSLLGAASLVSAAEGENALGAEAKAELAPGDIPVLVVDHFVAKPGEGKAFLEYFLANYQAAAEAAGLTLKRTLVSPPIWFKDMSNTIEVVWEMQGGNAFWGVYNAATRYDPKSIEFWADIKGRVEYHDRMYLGNAEELEAMNNV